MKNIIQKLFPTRNRSLIIRPYCLEYIMQQPSYPNRSQQHTGACTSEYMVSMNKWRLYIQLEPKRLYFLSVYFFEDGTFEKFSFDIEAAHDSHIEFCEEALIRRKLYAKNDENLYFHEILIRYLKTHRASSLIRLLSPYITATYYFD